MNNDQIASLVRTGMKLIAGVLAAHGVQNADGILNSPDVTAAALLIISLLWSHWTHGGNTPTPPPKLGVFLLCLLPLAFTGCNTTTFSETKPDGTKVSWNNSRCIWTTEAYSAALTTNGATLSASKTTTDAATFGAIAEGIVKGLGATVKP